MTCFNGQMSTVACNDQRFFVTHVDATKVNGEMIYVPVNRPFPIGFELKMQPSVSADHKFVRCNLRLEHSEMGATNVPLFPVTTSVTPVFEGGARGQPISFTQFVQQPNIVTRSMEKTVTIAAGQTAVLYAGKRQKVDESEADGPGAPLFDWIYDLVDMFSPPADPPMIDEHMFVLVTPRVICAGEAEEKAAACPAQPMPMGPCVPAPCCLTPTVGQCAAMADAPCCRPAEPCCSPSQACAAIGCPVPPPAAACANAASNQHVQLDVQILEMDPAAWDQPVTAAWADLSPAACENKGKVTTPDVTNRFCAAMKAQHFGKLIAEPRIVTLSGQPAKLLSGGQQACLAGMKLVERPDGSRGPEFETIYKPFGIAVTFLPVVDKSGIYLECECEMAAPGKTYRVAIESDGGEAVSNAVLSTCPSIKTCKVAVCLPESGKTFLRHCGRNAAGKDVIVMVTPHVISQPAAGGPWPMPVPCCAAHSMPAIVPVCPPAPMPLVACVASAPPAYEPPPVAGYVPPSTDAKLDRLMAKYRDACAAGDTAAALRYATKCMAIDPTCFGR